MGLSHFTDSLWVIFQTQSRISALVFQISCWQRKKRPPTVTTQKKKIHTAASVIPTPPTPKKMKLMA